MSASKEYDTSWETGLRRAFQTLIVLALSALFVKAYIDWLDHDAVFSMTDMVVEGSDFFTAEELVGQTGVGEAAHLNQLSLSEIQQRLEANPFLESVHVFKSFPDKVVLRVKEKTPVALLNVEGKFLCLDGEGLVLPSRPGRLYQLPVISGHFEGALEAGQVAGGKRVRQGLAFVKSLVSDQHNLYDKVSEVVVGHSKGMLVYTANHAIPVWFGIENLSSKLCYFEAIYEELKNKRQFSQVKYIDLRYANQVVLGMRS